MYLFHEQIIIQTQSSPADIYFSDGSVTTLDSGTKIELKNMEVAENNSVNLITKIRVLLTAGNLWNKVARLAEQSEFQVETAGAIAGVRGTEFGI